MNEDRDPIVQIVIDRMRSRSAVGMEKYGVTMMRDDVSTVEWIDHAIEELLDGAIYLERLKLDISSKNQRQSAINQLKEVEKIFTSGEVG
jgi:hypothetical protein|tara:strand:- start:207 stop:476 length:270 start_codon:yes stop_codon:yes gene_type:complete